MVQFQKSGGQWGENCEKGVEIRGKVLQKNASEGERGKTLYRRFLRTTKGSRSKPSEGDPWTSLKQEEDKKA